MNKIIKNSLKFFQSNKLLIANIYYKASNSLTIILFTFFIQDSSDTLTNYFLALAISGYLSTFLLINTLTDKTIGDKNHESILINTSNFCIIFCLLFLFLNTEALFQIGLILIILLKGLSDSFVAKRKLVIRRSMNLFFCDLAKIPIFLFSTNLSYEFFFLSLIFLTCVPDLKINRFKNIQFDFRNFFSKNSFSMSKNLEPLAIYLLINNLVLIPANVVYYQQGVSLINVFLMSIWQRKIHSNNNFIKHYTSNVIYPITFLGIFFVIIGYSQNMSELYFFASILLYKTVIIDPNLFMTNSSIRGNVALFYFGIFISSLLVIYYKIIFIYFITTIFLLFHLFISISNNKKLNE
tara:strand:- start:324 stop:1379 length:1056 start_codon:yes stop_codon:yes gene_type:complete